MNRPSEHRNRTSLDEFLSRNSDELDKDHGWEKRFTVEVLGRISEHLDFADVELQTQFVDDRGVTRRIDFTIVEGAYVRLAIEVDGFKKNGQLPDYGHFERWLLREQEIVRRGWRLLRFPNTQVKRDPAGAARNLLLTLERERADADRLAEAESGAAQLHAALAEAQAAERRELEVARELEHARTGPDVLSRTDASEQHEAALPATASVAELEAQLAEAQQRANDRFAEVEVVRGELVRGSGAVSVSQELAQLDEHREAELDELHAQIASAYEERDGANKEIKGMKTVAVATTVMALAICGLVFALTRADSGDRSVATASPSQGDSCSTATDWRDASSSIGRSATIRGPIVTATYRKLTSGSPTYLNMGAAYPDRRRVTVLIWGRSRSKFPNRPEAAYDGEDVAVTGVVTRFRGSTQIEINSPSAVEACGTT